MNTNVILKSHKFQMLIYFITGLSVSNLCQGAWSIVQHSKTYSDLYFNLILIPAYLPLLYLLIYKIHKKTTRAISLFIVGVSFILISQLLFGIIGNIHLVAGIGFSGAVSLMIYVESYTFVGRRLSEVEKIIQEKDTQMKALSIEFLHEENLFWLRQWMYLILGTAAVCGSAIAILWGDASSERQSLIFGSLYIITIYIYTLVGVCYWVFIPLVNNFELIHRHLIRIPKT